MRRLLVVILPILAVLAACSSASSTPGWTYAPAPSATPVASGGASGAPAASAAPSAAPSAAAPSAAPSVGRVRRPRRRPAPAALRAPAAHPAPAARSSRSRRRSGPRPPATTEKTLSAAANTPFTIHFDNQDNQAPHNVALKDSGGTLVALGGDITFFTGPGTRDLPGPGAQDGDVHLLLPGPPDDDDRDAHGPVGRSATASRRSGGSA